MKPAPDRIEHVLARHAVHLDLVAERIQPLLNQLRHELALIEVQFFWQQPKSGVLQEPTDSVANVISYFARLIQGIASSSSDAFAGFIKPCLLNRSNP